MDVWGWIAVYAVGLTLLQLLVYRYLLNSGGSLTRRVGTPFGDGDGDGDTPWMDSRSSTRASRSTENHDAGGDASSTQGRDAASARGRDAWPASADPAGVRHAGLQSADERPCPHCGAVNETDTTFTRCWNCTREL